ncbi:restriction endonuclease subunit S [Klebsiella quasipneumoniae]|uniref:restriction endonuclease subunit S n=1 Tax=Klebsiella quasipneumoniae TaxID=1463165 RepID=UPI0021140652|nr:restriction endonuclease subunit S [Klebsiella quasipneumoniae]
MEQMPVLEKYQPYPEYKDSGVEWLGNTPSHWTVTAIKRFASYTTGWTPPTGNDAYFGGDHLWANISDVGPRVLSVTAKTITDAGVRATRIKKSPKGSLLFSFKLSIGLVSIVGEEMYTNEAIATFLPSKTVNIAYMYWAAPLFIPQNAEENIYGAKLLNQERISNADFVLPTAQEQHTIAAFLDYETARIDKLIAKQQRLIELLKEKRQAVISHAVTKGLNPDAPMKDSGVEWLGEVPEHWVVLSLRYVIRTLEQGKSPECEARLAENDEWAVLKTGCVNGGIYSEKEHKALPSHISPHVSFEVKRGDLLMSRASGSRNLIGAVAYVHETRQKLLLSDKIFRLILEPNIDPQYLSLLMSSRPLRVQVEQAINGAEGLANNITKESIKSFAIVLPDVQEQLKVRSYLNQKLRKFENLEDKLKGGLVLLNERRSSLISSAVTGKIDLRGWEKPDA